MPASRPVGHTVVLRAPRASWVALRAAEGSTTHATHKETPMFTLLFQTLLAVLHAATGSAA